MISLRRFGIDFEGSIEAAIQVQVPVAKMRLIRGKLLWLTGGRLLGDGIEVDAGAYGRMKSCDAYLARADGSLTKIETVYEKSPKRPGDNLMSEICLQILAKEYLTGLGLGHLIADVRDIVNRPGRPLTFTMVQFEHVIDVHKALQLVSINGLRGAAFDIWFVPILSQIAVLMGVLEEHLGINHRDLKGDNLLISLKSQQQQRQIALGGRQWQITFINEIYVVDFGFSCRGGSGGQATVSAGPFFGLHDVCPKDGRDMYILLCYFYAQPIWRTSASERLLGLVRDLLGTPRLLEHLEEHGLDRTEYIYLLLNDRQFNSGPCSSVKLLERLSGMWPAAVGTGASEPN